MHALDTCSEKFNLSSIIIPSTFILSIEDIILLPTGIIKPSKSQLWDESSIDWNFSVGNFWFWSLFVHKHRLECTQSLQWRHNERDGVSNHQPHDCLLNRLFGRRSKKTSKLRVTGLCAGNSPGTGEFPAQRTSNAENVSIWWRHHESALSGILSGDLGVLVLTAAGAHFTNLFKH